MRWRVIRQFRREYRRFVKKEGLTPEAARQRAMAEVEWRSRTDAETVHAWITAYLDQRPR